MSSRRSLKFLGVVFAVGLGFVSSVGSANLALCEASFQRVGQDVLNAQASLDVNFISAQATILAHTIRNGDQLSQRQGIEALLKLEVPKGAYSRYGDKKNNEGLEAPLKALESILDQTADPSMHEFAIQGYLAYARKLSQGTGNPPDEFIFAMKSFEERILRDISIPENVRHSVHLAGVEWKARAFARPRIEPFLNDRDLAAKIVDVGREKAEYGERTRRHFETLERASESLIAEIKLGVGSGALREYAQRNGFVDLEKGGYWGNAIRSGLTTGDQVLVRIIVNPTSGLGITEHPYTKERIDWLPQGSREKEIYVSGVVAGIAGDASVYLNIQTVEGVQRLEVNSNNLKILELYGRSAKNKEFKEAEPYDPTGESRPQKGAIRRFLDRWL